MSALVKDVQAPPQIESNSGDLLRHELNNSLTGILGNAELLLLEMRRKNLALPPQAWLRLETITALAASMRETLRQLSDQCRAQAPPSLEETPDIAHRTHSGRV
jgi:signal transduction histidine kinase